MRSFNVTVAKDFSEISRYTWTDIPLLLYKDYIFFSIHCNNVNINDNPVDRKRRLGFKPRPGDTDRLWKKLTDSLTNIPSDGWESFEQHPHFQATSQPFYRIQMVRRGRRYIQEVPISVTGGVFNLEFSPDGKILSAACEKKNILIFDPLTQRIVRNIETAHSDSVNCVRFLDTRTFASCSDDTTVALWDVRNLKTRIRTLRGHSNWVKNIEYSSQNNLLVTSGFDGAIYTWELNKFTEGRSEGCYNKVFNMSGLMRMRLTPDAEKMVISTSKGFFMVIHDVNLDTMDKDLEGFKPDVYREMQETRGYHEMALNFTKLFHAKKNRVELIADFPEGDEAKTISSLRIHPQGWVAATRNLSSDDNSEWCCIHDIQTIPLKEEDDEMVSTEQNSSSVPPLHPGRSSSPLRGGVRFVNPFLAPGQESDSDTDSEGPPIAETWGTESGNIQIISTGLPTSRESRPGIRVNFRLRNNQEDSSSSSDEDETDGTNDPNTSAENNANYDDHEEENRAENIEVEGTNFLAASTLAALGDIFEPPNLPVFPFERELREREQIAREEREREQTAREERERRESEDTDDRIPSISLPPVYPGFGRSLSERNNRSSIAELFSLRELMKRLVKNVQNGYLLAKHANKSSSTTVTRAMSGSFGHMTKQLIAPSSHVTNQPTRRQNSHMSSTKESKEADSSLQLSYTSYERGKDASTKPPILIQHDLCGRKENFTKIGKQLFHLTKRNILLPDARNHGNSPESSAMSHKLMSGDIVKLLSGLKVKESSFVGFGLGGRIGMYTALVRPDLIDRLVVVSSSPVNTDARFQEWQNLIQSFYVIQTLKANFDSKKPIADLLQSQEFKLEATKALQPLISSDTYRALYLSNLAKFHASAIRTNPDLWKFPELENFVFKKPVLFLTGDREKAWSISDKDIRKIRYYFPDSHFVKISNAAFYPHLDSQEEFLEAVTSFLETDFQALNNGLSVED